MPGGNPTIATTPMASELAQFLDSLANRGRAVVAFHRLDPAHPAPTQALEPLAERASWELAGPAPALHIPAAAWAARILYQLCQTLALRDFDTDRLSEILAIPSPTPRCPETDWSVDLTFRHLPRLYSLAMAVPSPDSFLKVLHQLATDWPLSSVGLPTALHASIEPLPDAHLLQHPTLRRLYLDRIVATRDTTRVTDARVAEAIRADLGLHPELAPSLASRLQLA